MTFPYKIHADPIFFLLMVCVLLPCWIQRSFIFLSAKVKLTALQFPELVQNIIKYSNIISRSPSAPAAFISKLMFNYISVVSSIFTVTFKHIQIFFKWMRWLLLYNIGEDQEQCSLSCSTPCYEIINWWLNLTCLLSLFFLHIFS